MTQKISNNALGFSSLLLTGVIYGSFGVLIRLLNKELTIYQQIVFRNILALIFAVAIIITGKRLLTGIKRVRPMNLLLYGLTIPFVVILFNIAILNTKIVVATFAFYIGSIIFSWILGITIYKEKITPIKIVSILSALVGLFAFIFPLSVASLNIGFITALASGFLDAVSNVLRKNLSGKIDKFILVFITTVGGIFVSGFMIAVFKQNLLFISHLSMSTWVVGLIFGFALVAINYLLLVGFQYFELGLGSVILSSELLFASLFGLFIFGENLLPKEIIGGLFVVLAVILPNTNLLDLSRLKKSKS